MRDPLRRERLTGLGKTVAALGLNKLAAARAPARPAGPERLVATASFGADPGALRMLSYVPAKLAPRPALVVLLHGCTQTAEGFAQGAGWLDLADRNGFVVLAPEQTRANNPNLCFNWFNPEDIARGGGEAASIRRMIARTVKDHDVDPARIFIAGLSAGGAMANVLLATYPEVFAGGAIFAGLPYASAAGVGQAFGVMMGGGGRSPKEAADVLRAAAGRKGPWPPVSVWQGTADSTVVASVAEAVADQWVEVHGAQDAPVESESTPGRRRLIWPGADGAPVVELNLIAGMGHGVPLQTGGPHGTGTAGPFLLEVGVNAALELVHDWGLQRRPAVRPAAAPPVEAVVEPPAPKAASPQPEPAPRVQPRPRPMSAPPPQPAPRLDVTELINRALRTAGLLK